MNEKDDNDGLTPEQRAKIESVMPVDWKVRTESAESALAIPKT